LVEFAKSNKLPVIASNAPRPLASKAGREGSKAVLGDPNVAASSTAPEGQYRTKFLAQMGSHPGVTEKMVQGFYEAQCLKDDTMAESIVRQFDGGRRPLVVHVAGDFHVAGHLGTVERVRWRRPELRVAVISMPEPKPSLRQVGDDEWVLAVPIQTIAPPKPKAQKPAATAEAGKPATATPPAEEPAEPTQHGRPALGFMPDYESGDVGVRVTALRPGGPAEAAGLEDGDLIVKIGDEEVTDVGTYMEVLGNLTVGNKVAVTVKRGEATKTLDVVVGERIQ